MRDLLTEDDLGPGRGRGVEEVEAVHPGLLGDARQHHRLELVEVLLEAVGGFAGRELRDHQHVGRISRPQIHGVPIGGVLAAQRVLFPLLHLGGELLHVALSHPAFRYYEVSHRAHPIQFSVLVPTHPGYATGRQATRAQGHKDAARSPTCTILGMVKVFLAGDVMIGRGIDQILSHSVDPAISERYVKSAREYVTLAERVNGRIPRTVDDSYVWGDILAELDEMAPDVRIINLETAVTARGRPWPNKGISYRVHPANIGVLAAARIDVCALANNHVLDWSYEGLEDTIAALDAAGIAVAGAGRDPVAAESPATVSADGTAIRVGAVGSATSGIPAAWGATPERPGVAFVPVLSDAAADYVAGMVARTGALSVVSIHWGSNWGHRIPRAQTHFARRLIDAGVDVVHGHSSHHPKAIEVYRDRPILYGCGDLINDYEGIGGHEEYRGDLALAYFPTMGPDGMESLELTPFRMRRFRAERVTGPDVSWLARTLDHHSRPFGTRVEPSPDERLRVSW